MNFKNLWDKENTEALELNGVASLLYADEYYIVVNKYIYVLPDDTHKGFLIDKDGKVIKSNIIKLIPLMSSSERYPTGWVIVDDWSYWKIYGVLQHFKEDNSTDAFSILTDKDKYTVSVIGADGDIHKCKVTNSEPSARVILYKDNAYFKVNNGGLSFYFLSNSRRD